MTRRVALLAAAAMVVACAQKRRTLAPVVMEMTPTFSILFAPEQGMLTIATERRRVEVRVEDIMDGLEGKV